MSKIDATADLQLAKDTAEELLNSFFEPPNILRRQPTDNLASSDQELLAALQPSLRWYAMGRKDRSFLLPFKARNEEVTTWYACAATDASARALATELQAFIGPSYAHFPSTEEESTLAQIQAFRLITAAGWRTVRFRAFKLAHEEKIVQQWNTYWGLQARRPEVVAQIPKTFGQLRAGFDRALLAKNEVAANTALATLRERYGLTTENRTFLEIRLAAAFGRWEAIIGHRLFQAILRVHLPPETYGDVLEALYETHLQPLESSATLDDLLKTFSQTLLIDAAPLFRTRGTSRRPAVLKAFLLHELVQTPPDSQVCETLLESVPSLSFGLLTESLRSRVASLTTGAQFAQALAALDAELFDRAYGLLWPLQDDVKVLRGLLRCVREAEDPSKAAAVMRRLDAVPTSTLQAVKSASPSTYERVAVMAKSGPVNPASWTETVSFTPNNGETVQAYVTRWREIAHSEDPAVLAAETGFSSAAASVLVDLSIDHPSIFEQIYPLWFELFVERSMPDKRFVPIYLALLETLRARDVFGDPELTLMRDILASLVKAGVDASTYRKSVEEVQAVFEDRRSPHIMVWGLEICDILALAPCRDDPVRLRLLTAVTQAGMDFHSRLDHLQRSILKMLAEEANLEFSIPIKIGDTSLEKQASSLKCNLAFYSLDTEAGRRAGIILSGLYPSVHVQISSDEVCTKKLQGLARSADIFVFAWKVSKHPAYYCVKAALLRPNNLVMAKGGGTTSLVVTAADAIKVFLKSDVYC